METEKSITIENLVRPYSEEGFKEQLLYCGVPETSIEEIRSSYTGDDPTDNLLSRLYADIERSETRIIDGERHLQFTGAFVTDGYSVLLERHPDFGKKGYGMGGLFAYDGITPAENMLKEIEEETPLIPNETKLRLVSETTESSISPRLPNVMTHRNGYFFIYKADILKNMPKLYEGSDGDPHELYVTKIPKIKTDETIAKGWKKDVIKHILDNPNFLEFLPEICDSDKLSSDRKYVNLAKEAINQINYFGRTNDPTKHIPIWENGIEASLEITSLRRSQRRKCRGTRQRVYQIINHGSITDDQAVCELEGIIDEFKISKEQD